MNCLKDNKHTIVSILDLYIDRNLDIIDLLDVKKIVSMEELRKRDELSKTVDIFEKIKHKILSEQELDKKEYGLCIVAVAFARQKFDNLIAQYKNAEKECLNFEKNLKEQMKNIE